MNKNKTHIPELHEDLKTWNQELALVHAELKSLDNRLQEVANRNTDTSVRSQVEHFQNQFIRQNDMTDELANKLQRVADSLAENVKSNPIASDHRLVPDQPELREQVKTHFEIFRSLREEFHDFAGRWL